MYKINIYLLIAQRLISKVDKNVIEKSEKSMDGYVSENLIEMSENYTGCYVVY